MTKEEMIGLIRLLSALESWSFSLGKSMPDFLVDDIESKISRLTEEVLK